MSPSQPFVVKVSGLAVHSSVVVAWQVGASRWIRAVDVWNDGGSGVVSSQVSHRSQTRLGQSSLIVLQLGFSLCVYVTGGLSIFRKETLLSFRCVVFFLRFNISWNTL